MNLNPILQKFTARELEIENCKRAFERTEKSISMLTGTLLGMHRKQALRLVEIKRQEAMALKDRGEAK